MLPAHCHRLTSRVVPYIRGSGLAHGVARHCTHMPKLVRAASQLTATSDAQLFLGRRETILAHSAVSAGTRPYKSSRHTPRCQASEHLSASPTPRSTPKFASRRTRKRPLGFARRALPSERWTASDAQPCLHSARGLPGRSGCSRLAVARQLRCPVWLRPPCTPASCWSHAVVRIMRLRQVEFWPVE